MGKALTGEESPITLAKKIFTIQQERETTT